MVSRRLLTPLVASLLIAAVMLLAAHGSSASSGGDEDKNKGQVEDQALPIPDKAELKYPNLGYGLDRLVTGVEEGLTTAESAAAQSPAHRQQSVAVTIYLSGNVDEVVKFLEDNGGDPRNVGEDYIEAYVPVTLLGPVSEQPGVLRVREIIPAEPAQSTAEAVAGHGSQPHGAAAWNQAGYTGKGVKVGVIAAHSAFNGFSGLMGTELPSTVVARCYTDIGIFTQNVADCEDAEDGGNHGTWVAESVMDIAPEVSLYIADPPSRGDRRNTVDWMVSEGVQVIVWVDSSAFDGPGDGTSPLSISPLRTVDAAVAGGIVWVNAAGNHAQRTWFSRAPFLDGDSDGFIEFAGRDEVNDITLEAGDRLVVQLRWDDKWGGATRNLDLAIQDNVSGQLVALSVDPQSGGAGHIPMEVIVGNVLRNGQYGVVVEHAAGSVPDWIQLMVWGVPSIQHYTRSGSVTNPSESANPGLLAVGAAHWDDVRAIEPYSSRGPTPDGRTKPDVVGADCGATALRPLNEYNEGFCGTSQAASHVAGLAALVRQRFPSYTPAQVADYLKNNAAQREMPDPNNTWGHGFAQLPPPDGTPPTTPTLSNAFTRNPAADFDTLKAAGNGAPAGIWSDGTTMWVADWFVGEKIYAYDSATKARTPNRDFDTLKAAGNTWPEGIWSDGTTMWVADDDKIYAYDMATKARVPGKDFDTDTLEPAGNTWLAGIWSDGTTMWVADAGDDKLFAYDMATKARVPGKDFDSLNARNQDPEGIWSDGETMWVVDDNRDKIYAYDMATKARVSGKEFNTLEAARNTQPEGIWSDGETMWVSDWIDDKIYAYHMPQVVESAADREALTTLYNATGGAAWTNNANWLSEAHIGQWHGVTTDDDGRVTKLELGDNQLSGEVPEQLRNLANLKSLDLSDNQLTGPIPTWLGSLANLQALILSGNQLTGEIPEQLGSLANLEWLALSENELTGEIPAKLGSLANLEGLYLWGNQLSGEIPSELRNLANLRDLGLSENQLTGPVPTWLGSLANLEWLYLWGNQLTGEIPEQLGSLANLEGLYLWGNQLNGEIPAQLGSLANLEELRLDGNELSGEIPEQLGSLANLEGLWLDGNELSGEIPEQLGSLANLESLALNENQLNGEIPAQLGSLANLEELRLDGNELSGEIPEQLGSLANLERLWLDGNELSGEIPEQLRNLANLRELRLSKNELTGEIPSELRNLANLEGLYLDGNRLSGEIPSELGNLANLRDLGLSENQLTGPVPTWLGSLANLEWLWLGGNQLSGEIPEQLGNLVNLKVLDLPGNELTGELPQALTGLTVLEEFRFYFNPGLCAPVDDAFQTWLQGIAGVRGSSCALADSQEDRAVLVELHNDTDGGNWVDRTNWLSERPIREWYGVTNDADGRVTGLYLWENQLTGEMPASLGSLANLERLWLDGNELSGEIPVELGSLANLRELRLRGNRLTGCVHAGLREVLDDDFDELGLPLCGPSVTLSAASSAVRLGAP
ncbi:MAG: S8 family serine peptidase, partial [Chloroflexi bacterium]|nr:S8 family serine peptidase [Chloroflexota bacterium]